MPRTNRAAAQARSMRQAAPRAYIRGHGARGKRLVRQATLRAQRAEEQAA